MPRPSLCHMRRFVLKPGAFPRRGGPFRHRCHDNHLLDGHPQFAGGYGPCGQALRSHSASRQALRTASRDPTAAKLGRVRLQGRRGRRRTVGAATGVAASGATGADRSAGTAARHALAHPLTGLFRSQRDAGNDSRRRRKREPIRTRTIHGCFTWHQCRRGLAGAPAPAAAIRNDVRPRPPATLSRGKCVRLRTSPRRLHWRGQGATRSRQIPASEEGRTGCPACETYPRSCCPA